MVQGKSRAPPVRSPDAKIRWLLVSLELPFPPMSIFAMGIEHPLDMTRPRGGPQSAATQVLHLPAQSRAWWGQGEAKDPGRTFG
jgi:hypothetical protein